MSPRIANIARFWRPPMNTYATKKWRSWAMAQVRAEYNKSTEIRFIEILKECRITGWRRGYPLFGKPDFVFTKRRVAVFIDGCFWHGCRKHCRMPKSNTDYWENKIRNNILRDRAVNKHLKGKSWVVLRFWEHELKNKSAYSRKIGRLIHHLKTR